MNCSEKFAEKVAQQYVGDSVSKDDFSINPLVIVLLEIGVKVLFELFEGCNRPNAEKIQKAFRAPGLFNRIKFYRVSRNLLREYKQTHQLDNEVDVVHFCNCCLSVAKDITLDEINEISAETNKINYWMI